MKRLSRATLRTLPAGLGVPGYDPATVTAGIVHLGLGNFHRAHMARYADRLMAVSAEARRWGIVGATLLPQDAPSIAALAAQDGLYTLVERDDGHERATVVGALTGLIDASTSSPALLAAIDRPEIRIVSLTVTEHGYCLDRATKTLDPAHPLIVRDLAAPEAPASAIGVLVEAYRRRRAIGGRAFTALSCDNIQHNGTVLRDAVLTLARQRDPELAAWIAAAARFPATMVDRITPVTRDADAADLAARYGVADARPVFCERFTQWVIEDDFADGRPDWEAVGAQCVADVAPYEKMKLRLLNASHLAIAGLGRLIGYTLVDEAMRDPALRRYMALLMAQETAPTVPPVPGIDLAAYQATLIDRFANPAIRDTLDRVNTDAPLNYLLDPIRDRLARNQSITLLALALAAWLRRVRGSDDAGQPIEIHHPLAPLLRERAIAGGSDPRPLLSIRLMFGDLVEHPALVATVGAHLESLYAIGASRTLRGIASSQDGDDRRSCDFRRVT